MANYELSKRIYELRIQKNLSQKELGAILGVSNKAVSKWETGTAIPKTETLIKLAEVFEVSTEELLNMALPLQNTQHTSERIMMNPANARIGKTLSEFRAEYGLYLKDVAERIGVSEDELQSIEDSNLVPDDIAEKLVVAYNLPENNFAKPIFKSKLVTKKHFLKISILYQIILGFAGAIPIVIGSVFVAFGTFFNSNALFEASRRVNDVYFLLSPIVTIVGNIFLAKYMTEKTGYFGDFNKYKFLYATIPNAAVGAISSFMWLITGLCSNYLKENPDGISGVMCRLVQGGSEFVLSVVSMAVIAVVLAMLMNNTIEQNDERRRKAFKKIAIIVTVSCLLAYVLDAITSYVKYGGFVEFSPIKDFVFYGVHIVIVWLVYSIVESNPQKEKWAFKILPIVSICESLISEFIIETFF